MILKKEGYLLGYITHKESNIHFHVKSVKNCYHCSVRPLYRKRPKKQFFKPGDYVYFKEIPGWKNHGMLFEIVREPSGEDYSYLTTQVLDENHDCSLDPLL